MPKMSYLCITFLRIYSLCLCLVTLQAFLLHDTLDVWTTTGDGSKKLHHESINKGSGSGFQVWVNRNDKYQTIDGFGASLTNSAAYVIYNSPHRHQIMQTLFGFNGANGIGISYLRLTMGGSDFQAVDSYTYDDTWDDYDQNHFSIDKDKSFVIPILKEALSIQPKLKIMATPWSAPAWMKTSNTLYGGSFRSVRQYQRAYAKYFVKFIQAYQNEGIHIDAITIQNEPLHSDNSYPTMTMSWEAERDFIRYELGPQFQSNGIQTKILIYDHNWDNTDYVTNILNDHDANRYVRGSAWHCYAGRHDTTSSVHSKFPDKDIYFSECSGGDWSSSFHENVNFAFRILMIGQTRAWAKTVLFWNLALDQNHGPKHGVGGCNNCRGVVTVRNDGNADKNVEYYAIGQMTKFIQPGAVRVNTPGFSDWDGIHSVAFENPDHSVAIIVLNAHGSDTKSFYIDIEGNTFPYSLPPHSVASFLYH